MSTPKRQPGQVCNKIPDLSLPDRLAVSAIAAARSKPGAIGRGNVTTATQDFVAVLPLPSLTKSLESGHAESNVNEDLSNVATCDYDLCNWEIRGSKIHVDNNSELIIDLPKHSTLALVGYFDLTVYKGAININGANLSPSTGDESVYANQTFFMAATHPLYKIRGLDIVNHIRLGSYPEIVTFPSSSLFANIWNARPRGLKSRSFAVITRSSEDSMKRPLIPDVVSEDWYRAVEDCAATPSTTLVIGPTGAGKSTFGRRLVNRYLTGLGKSSRPQPLVYYLDLDPANPEYTPHGQVTLTAVKALSAGPNFMHSTTEFLHDRDRNCTLHAHPVPWDVVDYQEHYLACCNHLISLCRITRLGRPSPPLIVNTPGWLYDLESQTLTQIIAELKPQNIILIDDDRSLNLPTHMAKVRGTVCRLRSHKPLIPPLRSNADLRSMCMQSYFRPPTFKTKRGRSPTYVWHSQPVSSVTPWELRYQDLLRTKQDFLGFAIFSERLSPASLLHALIGSIVQIVQLDSPVYPSPESVFARTSRSDIPHHFMSTTGISNLLHPRSTKMVCTALVQGIDVTRKTVELLVPVPYDVILHSLSTDRVVLVGGCCEAPEWAFVEETLKGEWNQGHGRTPTDLYSIPYVIGMSASGRSGHLDARRRVRKYQVE